jgi:hypothetical protein
MEDGNRNRQQKEKTIWKTANYWQRIIRMDIVDAMKQYCEE